MSIKKGIIFIIFIALIGGLLYYEIPSQRDIGYGERMTGEDLQAFIPGDQWKWHIEVPLHLTGSSVSGNIYLHIDAWGNYTTIVDYDVNGIIEKSYYISLEGWGLGDGTLDTSYGNFDVRINGDPTSGSDGYNSNVPFRVLGHRIVRISDLADMEMRIHIPDAWLHADAGLLGYDEVEMKLDSNLTFWNETKPYIPDNMDFPVNVGEKMWYNTSIHTWGYMWHGDDSQGYVSEDNSTFDDNATWNYTFDYPIYHNVTVGAGTFSCYNATGTNTTGESHIYLEYAPDLKWYAKEIYENIGMGSSGYMTLKFEVTSYNIGTSSNSLTLNSNEIYQGESLTISGNIPDAQNSNITIGVPEYGAYITTNSDSSGQFAYSIDRFPLLNDTTHTSIDYGSVGIVAYPINNPGDLCGMTLTIHKLPSHIIYGYIKVGNLNLNNTTINITNVATGDRGIVSPDATGYYEIDISCLPYGYKNGEEIKGVIMENGTQTSYSNTTTVDTSVGSQRMDFVEVVPEVTSYLLILLMLPVAIKIKKFNF